MVVQLGPGEPMAFGRNHKKMPLAEIAKAFFRAGYIEAWGRGIEKIRHACREHDIQPPLFDCGMSGLMLTFLANPAHLPATAAAHEAAATPKTTPKTTQETTQEKGRQKGEGL